RRGFGSLSGGLGGLCRPSRRADVVAEALPAVSATDRRAVCLGAGTRCGAGAKVAAQAAARADEACWGASFMRAVVGVHLGTAGWTLPRGQWPHLPAVGTYLQRYAARLRAMGINSSFYRAHRPATYARWADSVPPGFRFSVKVPKQITHEARLLGCEGLLQAFLHERSEEHTSELQSRENLVCRLL